MSAPPPSKPDRRFSRIRLSSRWVLCREGAALRLVPKSVGQTFGITQANCTRLIPSPASPRGHSRWFAFPSFCPSHFHLPASLRSTVVTRFYATTNALTPAGRFFGHNGHEHRTCSESEVHYLSRRCFLPFCLQTYYGHERAFQLSFASLAHFAGLYPHRCRRSPRRGAWVPAQGFAFLSQAHPCHPTESSSRSGSSEPACYGLAVRFQLLSTVGLLRRSYFQLQIS